MAGTVAGIHLGIDTHANRPAANTCPDGSVYSCSTHSLIYKSNYAGNSWSTWASLVGSGFADPMTTRGDIIVRDAANATARLAIGAAGTVLGRVGSDIGYLLPPGYEFDYAEITAGVTPTATTDATANTVVTGNAVVYDGATAVLIEYFTPNAAPNNSASAGMTFVLYDGATSIGQIGFIRNETTIFGYRPIRLSRRLTPSAASHTYSVRAFVSTGTGQIGAGAGGSGVTVPSYMRITKAA